MHNKFKNRTMKATLTVLTFLLIIFNGFAQEKIKTKRISNNYPSFWESYRVLKEDKITKHGEYKKGRHVSNQVIEKGQYEFGEKVGVWEYYTDLNDETSLELKYNYSNDTLLFYSNKDNSVYEVFFNNKWINKEVSEIPLFIGSKLTLYLDIISNVDIPSTAKDDKAVGPLMINLIINENGEIESVEKELSLRDDCFQAIVEAVEKCKIEWNILEIDGKKVKFKYPLTFVFKYTEWTGSNNQKHSLYFVDTPENKTKYVRNQF